MANEIDAHVGMRLRQRRWMLGLTQQQLGDRVGIKFQQIQKYETGQNRISASRLWALAKVCETPVSYFFEGLSEPETANAAKHASKGDPLADREAAELLRAYYAAAPARRRAVFELMRVLADNAEAEAQAETSIAETDAQAALLAAPARPASRAANGARSAKVQDLGVDRLARNS